MNQERRASWKRKRPKFSEWPDTKAWPYYKNSKFSGGGGAKFYKNSFVLKTDFYEIDNLNYEFITLNLVWTYNCFYND